MHDSLAGPAGPGDFSPSHVLVHVLGFPTDERFVRFNLTDYLAEGFCFHRQSDSVEHMPSALLSHANGAGQLATADSVLGVGDAPHGREPLVQPEWRILKDGPHF